MASKPRPIQQIIGSSRGIGPLLDQSRLQARLADQVRHQVPESLREHIVAARLKGTELLIYADSPAWSSRLRYLSRELKRGLLRKGLKIGSIRVRVTIEAPRRIPPKRRIRNLSTDNARLLEQTADGIASSALQAALRRLARHRRS